MQQKLLSKLPKPRIKEVPAMIAADLNVILPEILLAAFALVGLLGAVYTSKDKVGGALVWLTAVVFVLLAAWIGLRGEGTRVAFNGMFIEDSFARFAKVTILLSAAAVLMMSENYMRTRGLLRFEYPVLVALSAVGMMMMVSAGDLMALYMGLELQSLALYVVASLRRDSVKSTEAGLKYFVLGALSSGVLLYGASLVYGYAGTTLFSGIITTVQGGETSIGLLFGIVFLISGLAFKVSAVPFHMWTPDVYEGSPTPITAFFATAPKVAAMALFARVLHDAFGNAVSDWSQIIALLSLLSMFLGAVAAIGQTNIKRLMAYSSIAHMGYALMGLAAGTAFGVQAMLVYMAIYVTMNVGTFAFILMMSKDGAPVTDIGSLNMYSKTNPTRALAMLALLFSLAGVPPMLGFFGKLYVLRAAYEADLAWLAIAGVIASVIGAYYYLRIVFYMYFGEEQSEPLDNNVGPILPIFLIGSALIMVFGIVNMFGIEAAAQAAAGALVN
jgi:NADH-quinone oxidoreductase subunit N